MFTPNSRYADAGTYQVTSADGTVATATRIPLPMRTPVRSAGIRAPRASALDLIATSYLKDPTRLAALRGQRRRRARTRSPGATSIAIPAAGRVSDVHLPGASSTDRRRQTTSTTILAKLEVEENADLPDALALQPAGGRGATVNSPGSANDRHRAPTRTSRSSSHPTATVPRSASSTATCCPTRSTCEPGPPARPSTSGGRTPAC